MPTLSCCGAGKLADQEFLSLDTADLQFDNTGTAPALRLLRCRLHAVLRPFMMRRLKESVATELPQKVGDLDAVMSRAALL